MGRRNPESLIERANKNRVIGGGDSSALNFDFLRLEMFDDCYLLVSILAIVITILVERS